MADTTSTSSWWVKRKDCSSTTLKRFGHRHAAQLEYHFVETTFSDFMVRRFDLTIVKFIVCTGVPRYVLDSTCFQDIVQSFTGPCYT